MSVPSGNCKITDDADQGPSRGGAGRGRPRTRPEADAEAVRRRLAEVERKQHNLVRRLATVEDDDVAFLIKVELDARAQHARQLMTDKDALDREREGWQSAQSRLDDLNAWCRTVALNLDGATYALKRLALDALGVMVRVWQESHIPHYEIAMTLDIVETTGWRS